MIVFYSDIECTKKIETINWNNSIFIKLFNGTEEVIDNAHYVGDTATITFYGRNESSNRFGLSEVKCTNSKVNVIVNSDGWLYPNKVFSITLSFKIDNDINSDIPLNDSLIVKGYFVRSA